MKGYTPGSVQESLSSLVFYNHSTLRFPPHNKSLLEAEEDREEFPELPGPSFNWPWEALVEGAFQPCVGSEILPPQDTDSAIAYGTDSPSLLESFKWLMKF